MGPEVLIVALESTPGGGEPVCGAVDNAGWLCTSVLERTGNRELAQVADAFVARPLTAAFILLGAFLVNALIRRAISRLVCRLEDDPLGRTVRSRVGRAVLDAANASSRARRVQRAETVGALLRSLSTLVVWTFAILIALGELGLNLGPLIAGAGIIGVAVGFGSQSLVRDFLSGIFMTVEDQYGVGDIIDVGSVSGTVESVSLRTTRLRDVEGVVWHVPNGEIRRVGNKGQHWSRSLLDVPLAHDTEVGWAIEVIQEVADGLSGDPDWKDQILERPEVWGLERFDADGLAVRVVVKTAPLAQWKVSRELRQRLKENFDTRGIEVPQTTISIRNQTET
ncbi:MAG: mechanosensitive ion channel family protein [Acidimicrobiia bacterium]